MRNRKKGDLSSSALPVVKILDEGGSIFSRQLFYCVFCRFPINFVKCRWLPVVLITKIMLKGVLSSMELIMWSNSAMDTDTINRRGNE